MLVSIRVLVFNDTADMMHQDWNSGELKKYKLELRNLIGNILLRLQSEKIYQRLPNVYEGIPLHRVILMTRGNALTIGPPGFDHVREDMEFLKVRDILHHRDSDFSCEYTDKQVGEKLTSESGRILYYSDLPDGPLDEEPIVSPSLRLALDQLRGKVCYHMKQYEVAEATQSIVNVLTELNKEITRIKPWSADTDPRDIGHLLTWSRETLRICGIMLQPFIPVASQTLLDALRVERNSRNYADARVGWGHSRPGGMLREILFPDLEQRQKKSVESDHRFDEKRMRRVKPKVATCVSSLCGLFGVFFGLLS